MNWITVVTKIINFNLIFARNAQLNDDWGICRIEPYNLKWYEEAGDPLDFQLNSELSISELSLFTRLVHTFVPVWKIISAV